MSEAQYEYMKKALAHYGRDSKEWEALREVHEELDPDNGNWIRELEEEEEVREIMWVYGENEQALEVGNLDDAAKEQMLAEHRGYAARLKALKHCVHGRHFNDSCEGVGCNRRGVGGPVEREQE